MTTFQRIAERRKQIGLSQEELAFKANTNQRQISRYERGVNDPTGDVLVKIADALDTTTDWLLGRTAIADRPMRGQGDLTEEEIEIIHLMRRNPDKRKAMYTVIKEIAQV